jgi:hypothetical protein
MRRVYEWRSSGLSRIPNYDTHSYWSFYDLTTNGTFLASLKGYVVILLEILVMCYNIYWHISHSSFVVMQAPPNRFSGLHDAAFGNQQNFVIIHECTSVCAVLDHGITNLRYKKLFQ